MYAVVKSAKTSSQNIVLLNYTSYLARQDSTSIGVIPYNNGKENSTDFIRKICKIDCLAIPDTGMLLTITRQNVL